MLKTIDILLGLTVVMLIASMAVTVLTQFINGLANMRGKHLMRGLSDLLQQIDPTLKRAIAERIAHSVLTHPMISNAGQRLGDTIHREEFSKLLMDLAVGDEPESHKYPLSADARQILLDLVKKNGIADPANVLDKVRAHALQLELEQPELAGNVRHSIALIKEANSRLIGKINGWFDQTIDRVSDRFSASTRVITFCCSVFIVAAIQLDTIDVINRLAMDDNIRNALVTQAFALQARQGSEDQPRIDIQTVKSDLTALQELGVVNIIGSKDNWCRHWREVNAFGVILSVFLLSMGAPFWYTALKNLLKLRGSLAGKDDVQRQVRQNAQKRQQADGSERQNPVSDASQPIVNLPDDQESRENPPT
ncbi:MAG: hypothetical protein ACU836_17820 [Gammaproteobacteria bacterium]